MQPVSTRDLRSSNFQRKANITKLFLCHRLVGFSVEKGSGEFEKWTSVSPIPAACRRRCAAQRRTGSTNEQGHGEP